MAPSSKFVSRIEKEGIKHSPSTRGLSHRTPCQPWHSLSCLQAASTFWYLQETVVLQGALLTGPSCCSPSMGSSFCTSRRSYMLPPATCRLFPPSRFLFYFFPSWRRLQVFIRTRPIPSPTRGFQLGTAHMPDHFLWSALLLPQHPQSLD